MQHRRFSYPEEGTKSYGYRFVDSGVRCARRRRMPLNDPKLAQRIDNHRKKHVTTRTDRWLRSQLFKLGLGEIDEEFLRTVADVSVDEKGGDVRDKLDACRYVLQRIGKQEPCGPPMTREGVTASSRALKGNCGHCCELTVSGSNKSTSQIPNLPFWLWRCGDLGSSALNTLSCVKRACCTRMLPATRGPHDLL